MYKIDRRGGAGVQKSYTRTDPIVEYDLFNITTFIQIVPLQFL